MNCIHCNGGFYSNGKPCRYCMTPDRFIAALDKAIRECDAKKDRPRLEKLKAVRHHLPEYPVMALMEAEGYGLADDFVGMLQQAFDVKPFMDVSYKKVEVQG